MSNAVLRHVEITEIKKNHISVKSNVRALIFCVCIPWIVSLLLVNFQLDAFAIKFAKAICARTRRKIFTVYHYQRLCAVREGEALSDVER